MAQSFIADKYIMQNIMQCHCVKTFAEKRYLWVKQKNQESNEPNRVNRVRIQHENTGFSTKRGWEGGGRLMTRGRNVMVRCRRKEEASGGSAWGWLEAGWSVGSERPCRPNTSFVDIFISGLGPVQFLGRQPVLKLKET